jgi:hypothetical protein
MFFTCGSASRRGPAAPRVLAVRFNFTFSAPMRLSAAVTSFSITSLSGQAGVVSSTVTSTSFPPVPPTLTSFTMFKVTMSLNSSGSFTVRNAAITCSFVKAIWAF